MSDDVEGCVMARTSWWVGHYYGMSSLVYMCDAMLKSPRHQLVRHLLFFFDARNSEKNQKIYSKLYNLCGKIYP